MEDNFFFSSQAVLVWSRWFSLKGWVMAIINQMNTGTVSKTMGKLLRNKVECIIITFFEHTDTILNWTLQKTKCAKIWIYHGYVLMGFFSTCSNVLTLSLLCTYNLFVSFSKIFWQQVLCLYLCVQVFCHENCILYGSLRHSFDNFNSFATCSFCLQSLVWVFAWQNGYTHLQEEYLWKFHLFPCIL